jgi:hypothetical protein
VEQVPGGYRVTDAHGRPLAYVYGVMVVPAPLCPGFSRRPKPTPLPVPRGRERYPPVTRLPTKKMISSADKAPDGGAPRGATLSTRMYVSCPGLIKLRTVSGS